MTKIVWTEGVPSITSTVGSFPRYAQSVWSSIAVGMATSMFWDGSGGGSAASAGGLKPGGSRAFFDVQSNSSTPTSQATARLFLASDTSRLFMYDSGGTFLAGTPFYTEYQSPPTGANGMLMQSGSMAVAGGGSAVSSQVTFTAPFAAAPTVQLTAAAAGGSQVVPAAFSITSTGFFLVATALAGAAGGTFYWTAIGSSASFL